MSTARNPPQPFVFVEGFEPAHSERTIRSYVSRKAWRAKRLEQVRKYQKSSSIAPLSPLDPHQPPIKSSAKQVKAHGKACRPYHRETQPRVFIARPLPLDTTRPATDDSSADGQHDSLLTATERELINVDPFLTLPCRLDRSGQDLAHQAKSLFLHHAPNWVSALFTETTGLQLAYMYKANFCSMLAGAGKYLDSLSGRGPSLQTLQWASATTGCVRRTLSNPATLAGDEALMGVFLLLANDAIVDGGKNSHLHSKALARLFRLRGGVESLHLPHSMELFVNFNLITFNRFQTAYLDYMGPDAEGVAELQEWKADVDFLIFELEKLNTWNETTLKWDGRAERRALLFKVAEYLTYPKDVVEEDQWAFIVCYLAVMLWEYRYRPKDGDILLRNLTHRCEQLKPGFSLADVAWLLAQGLDNGRLRKWQVIRMIRVVRRLSKGLRLKIARFLSGLVDSRQAQEVLLEGSLDAKDFENIYQEAFEGMPVMAFDEMKT